METTTRDKRARLKGLKVLVIDDEPEITGIIEAFLDRYECEVRVENSAVAAVEAAEAFQPHVVILDITMPHMDGYEVCSRLRKIPQTAKVPILFLTGKDSKEDSRRSFDAGGDIFIRKPFSCDRLLEMVNLVALSINR